MPKKIYIVEDEKDIADIVKHYLKNAGYGVEVFEDGEKALRRVRLSVPDLLLLDLMLPGMDGLEICRLLRSEPPTKKLPIIMLTAKGEETDKIVGLEMGADDYITKPFSPKELVARVKALFRRNQPDLEAVKNIQYGKLFLDIETHTVTVNNKEVTLTAKEFALLEYLLQRKGKLVSRDNILDAVWGMDYYGGNRTIDVHIRHLREKIPLLKASLVTVKSFGYKLKDEK
ncbi:MAG: DNA-binding response regulator [Candidatus Edwardsbacteria bacterium RIFOXYD12_FULL_50_11]|uniref:DNA-binding response regulator n=1 Tax=Candidatus Edwardsbacteria bacterium GWF2_54_11 TaxID=1817851 RepID=A0A1F5RIE5_9BACT|nr:MAG: DNA-binding response regulator [Candidatus Edwardsbacteria bacterium RifOxyC12_full_54_24]OGF07060.1 MAG: DNA-binding response regulator [Candidatus Edwardsbacteria bacterium RifOxyA12_full_54_48]OGF10975.1 MAG: DNA-binding response regulator [Candidatus Edwardsbacteria bacterium GWE2_54_12]OGF14122.1 MAG: DNA-binding response regulator [Candidatus Edwardsbacteria bacterium GWF2_54_11]OGF15920.1 MAG: DNA-binding response regulator [Candidatus Edwardsbacteria bacterium RIFOXYD12_FULL_50_